MRSKALPFGTELAGKPPTVPARRYAPSTTRVPSVIAGLAYLKPTTERPYHYMYEPPDGAPRKNCEYDVRDMRITDARRVSARPLVHREGFELWDAPSAVTDFLDGEAVVNVYYKEAAELALAVTGARQAYVF